MKPLRDVVLYSKEAMSLGMASALISVISYPDLLSHYQEETELDLFQFALFAKSDSENSKICEKANVRNL